MSEPAVLIRADDLTGALHSAAPVAAVGMRCLAATSPDDMAGALARQPEVLSVDLGTRHGAAGWTGHAAGAAGIAILRVACDVLPGLPLCHAVKGPRSSAIIAKMGRLRPGRHPAEALAGRPLRRPTAMPRTGWPPPATMTERAAPRRFRALLRDALKGRSHREDADFSFHPTITAAADKTIAAAADKTIAAAADNHEFETSMRAPNEHGSVGMRFRGLSLQSLRGGRDHAFDARAAIFAAIRGRRVERAREAMPRHLTGSRDRLSEGRLLDHSSCSRRWCRSPRYPPPTSRATCRP